MGESLGFPEGTGFQASRALQGQSPSRGGDCLRPQHRALCTGGLAGVTCRPYRRHSGSRASAQAGTRAAGGTARPLEVVRTRTRRAPDGRYSELASTYPRRAGSTGRTDPLLVLWTSTLPWKGRGCAVDEHAALEGRGSAVDEHAALEGAGLHCGGGRAPL